MNIVQILSKRQSVKMGPGTFGYRYPTVDDAVVVRRAGYPIRVEVVDHAPNATIWERM
jgi:hypothetical protein